MIDSVTSCNIIDSNTFNKLAHSKNICLEESLVAVMFMVQQSH